MHQLEQQLVAEVIDLPKFRHLLKEELQQEDARKAAMTGLISKIEAYPDRKIVVDFRIGEVEKGTHGDPGAPTSGHTPYPICSRYEFQTFSRDWDAISSY